MLKRVNKIKTCFVSGGDMVKNDIKMEIKGTQKITKSEIKSSNLISSVSTLIANH